MIDLTDEEKVTLHFVAGLIERENGACAATIRELLKRDSPENIKEPFDRLVRGLCDPVWDSTVAKGQCNKCGAYAGTPCAG